MTSQPPERPDPPENSNPILRRRDRLIRTFEERDWSGFLVEVLIIIIGVGGPGGFIAQQIIEKAFPNLLRGYWIAFGGAVVVLFPLCVVLELLRRRTHTGSSSGSSRQLFSKLAKLFIFFLFGIAVLFAWKPVIHPFIAFITSSPNDKLSCDFGTSRDCFSWGENALLPNEAFTGSRNNDDWKAKCLQNQTIKRSGTSSYNPKTFEVAKQNFESYIEPGLFHSRQAI